MGRRVITQGDIDREKGSARETALPEGLRVARSPTTTSQKDDFASALVKYIPAEIVAAFVFINGVMGSTAKPAIWAYWVVFALLLILTPLYLLRVTKEPNKPPAVAQIVVSTIAFAIWVFAIGGPFGQYTWYASWYGAVLLALYTMVIPIILGSTSAAEIGTVPS